MRQLRNVLERLVVSHPSGRVTAADLANLTFPDLAATPAPPAPPPEPAPGGAAPLAPEADERERVLDALKRAGYVQARAARLLGMTVRQLRYRIAKHQIPVERF